MNRLKSYCCFSVIVCFSVVYSQQTFVQQHGHLRVSGTHIVDQYGAPLTLRGMAMYHSIDAGKYYTDSVVKWLRDDWSCTVLRGSIWAADYPNENRRQSPLPMRRLNTAYTLSSIGTLSIPLT